MRKNLCKIVLSLVAVFASACGGKSFNVASDGSSFLQSNSSKSVPVDILWVVDNSGSMATSQAMLATNVASFIDKFTQTNFDFRVAVVATDAFKGLATQGTDPTIAKFRDGARDYFPNDGINDATSSGVFVINPTTPNIYSVFQINVLQGIYGSGDERGFQSMEAALLHPENAATPFPRPGAFLVVIFLTDTEDFSWDGTANIQRVVDPVTGQLVNNTQTDPRLHPISRYLGVLDTVTNSTATKKNYMVSTIGVFDQACRNQVLSTSEFSGLALRYGELTDATGGIKASLCDNFDGILSNISDSILEFSTKFYLNRTPLVDTIKVYVNGALVPAQGYSYNAAENSISFLSGYIPAQGSSIRVEFTPSSLK
ncbi:VWA domain-containing protein [bacterium]|nr:VWA domain-containing protein [bacterium]